ncbi:MAG: UDP-N-acetylmuramoyl-L-alanine--D-glutamate ligase [Bdellovibrionaceae bacterium]|nr:UDP-N-acetylmuramoyl-L-alanine--D-glutamate ligase [Pseudobdellovibrionaceae bacterium]
MSFDLKTQIQPPVIIIGLARSGLAAHKLLLAAGFQEKDILTYDEHKTTAQYRTEKELEALTHIKTAIISPGVSLQKKFIQNWRSQGVFITSEIHLALSQISTEKIIGITGSLGKSTTTSIIGAGILSFDENVFVGGNLGIPFCEYALSIHKNPSLKAKWIVLELSSYQLENAGDLALDYSMITFLSPNHLERYSSLEEYYDTKWTILKRTRTRLILNESGGDLKSFVSKKKTEKIRWASAQSAEIQSYRLSAAQLIGKHNQDNLAMAAVLGLECGFPLSYFAALREFRGLKHRMENLGSQRGNVFINDSKATTIDSVRAAVHAVQESFPNEKIRLLLGGRDKKLPWSELKYLATDPGLEILFFGEHGQIIQQTLGSQGPYFSKLSDLLQFLSSSGWISSAIILFSPGGVSQDEFSSFEERGEFFRSWVQSVLTHR